MHPSSDFKEWVGYQLVLAVLCTMLTASATPAQADAGRGYAVEHGSVSKPESVYDAPNQCVILLHGLARTNRSMRSMSKFLQARGYHVVNQGYDSRSDTVEKLAPAAIKPALEQCAGHARVHFVTHSMGGILLRQYLSAHSIENLGRAVMLGPPNQGSEAVDKLSGVMGFNLLNGPAGAQLGANSGSLPNQLGVTPKGLELGVIAGTRSINLVLSQLLPKPNDGKVSVRSTKLEGMQDHLVLPVTHTFMMNNEKVQSQVLHFLQQGRFESEPKK